MTVLWECDGCQTRMVADDARPSGWMKLERVTLPRWYYSDDDPWKGFYNTVVTTHYCSAMCARAHAGVEPEVET